MKAKKFSADSSTPPRCFPGELDTIDHMLRLARGDADGEWASATGEGPMTSPAPPRPQSADGAETTAHLLTSLAAKAFGAGDYWTSLRAQLEVDDYVSFIRYCAAHHFPALKTQHLYEWLSSYSDVLRSGAPGTMVTPSLPPSPAVPGSRPSSAATQKKDSVAGAKGAKGKGAADAGTPRASQAEPVPTSPTHTHTLTQAPRLYEELLLEEVRDFLGREVELYWKWEHTPRDTARRESIPTNAKGKKNTKGDRAKAQQQTEEEELRRQAAAALPPENIYLAPEEAQPFVKYFLAEGLVQHAALYRAAHACQPPTAPRPTRALLLDLPPPLPTMDNARLLPTGTAASAVAAPHDKKGAAAAAAAPEAAVATPEEPALPSPRTSFRAAQMEELEVYERRYAAEEASRAGREKAEQLERDMQVLIDRHGTQKAVDDVYSEMEDGLVTRQLRILQRVAALERVLGMGENEEAGEEEGKK